MDLSHPSLRDCVGHNVHNWKRLTDRTAICVKCGVALSEREADDMDKSREKFMATAYDEWCRNPAACVGKGYCPLDPNCGD